MRAAVVTPGAPHTAHVADVDAPRPVAGEVLVEPWEVAFDGTDREIAHGYGEPPAGEDHIVLGHEAVGSVIETGEGVHALAIGDVVVPLVRRPDPQPCANCARGESDMCLDGRYTERGIKGRHGFCSDLFVESVEFLVIIPAELAPLGVLVEPLSIAEKALEQVEWIAERRRHPVRAAAVLGAGPIGLLTALALRARDIDVTVYDRLDDGPRRAIASECGAGFVKAVEGRTLREALPHEMDLIVEATGYSPLAFESVEALKPGGIVCLTGVSSGDRTATVNTDAVNLRMVLDNDVMFGTVSSNRRHFEAALADLRILESRWPGLLARTITRRLPIERFAEGLEKPPGDIKPVIVLRDRS